jgi:predicted RNase H-like HicB family nuclease
LDHTPAFAVVLQPEEEGGFAVPIPFFPEIVSYGKDERAALVMAGAIRLVLENCAARGEPMSSGASPGFTFA